MFTGLIEEVGTMRSVKQQGEAMVLTLQASHVTVGVQLGDSIAVNGVCLTVTSFDARSFTVDVMPQSFRKSNLHLLKPGDKVNLERAMLVGSRFGGHIVQGHVDGTGVVVAREKEANAVIFTIKPHDSALLRYIIAQGSVTLDGISLTVGSVDQDRFTVWIIPHTLKETALYDKQVGQVINIENDVLGKYVDHLLHYRGQQTTAQPERAGITAAFLAENGFY